jgi:hypothetical protein
MVCLATVCHLVSKERHGEVCVACHGVQFSYEMTIMSKLSGHAIMISDHVRHQNGILYA